MGTLLFVLTVIAVVSVGLIVLIAWLSRVLDRSRIRSYIEKHGGRVLRTGPAEGGPGAAGERPGATYVVRYRDRDGREHEGHFRTSLWEGVHVTADRVVEQPAPEGARPTA